MNLFSKFTMAIGCIVFSAVSFAQANKTVTDYLGIPGPVTLNKINYSLAWSSHPSSTYYKQEYIPAGEKVERFNKMILVEVLTGDAKPADLAAARINELNEMKKSNPMVNYEMFQKDGEIIIDFLLSDNAANGKINILERNVYRYKAITDKSGKKGVMLFGASERSYGNAAEAFLIALKKNKSVLVNAVAAFVLPQVTLKK